MDKKYRLLIILLTMFMVITLLYVKLYIINDAQISIYSKYFAALLAIISLVSAILSLKTLKNNPTSLTISVIGYPSSGKTVYLTMLFEELQQYDGGNIVFSPYGMETIERVLEDTRQLTKGIWPRRTPMNSIFYYRAYVTLKNNFDLFGKETYKLEIGDFAGEYTYDLNDKSERSKWLHKSEYFRYVNQSDIIFLAADIERIMNNDEEETIDGLIAVIQVLSERNTADNKKITLPVCLLLLKSDLINSESDRTFVDHRISRLVRTCQSNCQKFSVFFVAAVGENLSSDKKIIGNIKPKNVIEPLIWSLKRI